VIYFNVYKIDTGRSVRVRSGVSASFKIFALTAEGNVLGGEGSCPGGNYPGNIRPRGGHVQGNVLHLSGRRIGLGENQNF